jgi:hypothetical protein
MKNIKIGFIALATSLALSPVAFGDTIQAFTQTQVAQGLLFSGSVDITTNTAVGSGTLTITGLNVFTPGFVDPVNEAFIVAPVNDSNLAAPTNTNDNSFKTTVPNFNTSDGGILLQFTNGLNVGDYVWITSNGKPGKPGANINNFNIYDQSQNQLAGEDISGAVTKFFTPTPEPSSLFLLGTGMLSMAGLVFWKSKSSANSLPALTL